MSNAESQGYISLRADFNHHPPTKWNWNNSLLFEPCAEIVIHQSESITIRREREGAKHHFELTYIPNTLLWWSSLGEMTSASKRAETRCSVLRASVLAQSRALSVAGRTGSHHVSCIGMLGPHTTILIQRCDPQWVLHLTAWAPILQTPVAISITTTVGKSSYHKDRQFQLNWNPQNSRRIGPRAGGGKNATVNFLTTPSVREGWDISWSGKTWKGGPSLDHSTSTPSTRREKIP